MLSTEFRMIGLNIKMAFLPFILVARQKWTDFMRGEAYIIPYQ